jgi:hypothetical protein
MADATLFEVQTARGNVYAIHDPSTGMVWTERTEQAARLLAADKGLSVTLEKTISQEQLLTLTGRDAPRPHSPPHASPQPARPAPDNRPKESQSHAAPATHKPKLPNQPNPFAASYHWDDDPDPAPDQDPGIIVGGATKAGIQSVFAQTEIPAKPPTPADADRKDVDAAGPLLTNEQVKIDPSLVKPLKAAPPPRPGEHA